MESGIPTKWTDFAMRAVTCVAMALCAVGFVAPAYNVESGSIDPVAAIVGLILSIACALCLFISNCMAANAPVCFGNGKPFAGFICVAVCIGGGLVSMNSTHLGWEVFKHIVGGRYTLPSDEIMAFLFGFMAFSKAATNWVVHAIEEINRLLRTTERDKDRAESERRAERLMESEARAKRNQEAESRRNQFRVASTTALASVAAIGIPSAANAESPKAPLVESARVSSASADEEAHAAHGWKGPRDQAKWSLFKECVRRGMTNQKEIAEEVGIPTTTAHRWWNAMHAHSPQAANA